jgi:diguanylate cyclase (GGDEF)-like protein
MWTPRGMDLLMAYGPVSILVVVLLPVQRGLAGTIRRMASERARMEVMLHRDPLTGIHNRRLGERLLRELLGGAHAAGVIMLDVDRFKAINDTHGHPVGDRVLQAIAERCKALLRADESISRWGGEEFLVIVPGIDAAGLRLVADRLQMAIAHLQVAPVRQVTASFGATLIDAGDTFDALLQRVDRALYAAKEQGGDRVVLVPEKAEGKGARCNA